MGNDTIIQVVGNGIKDCGQCNADTRACPFRYTLELMRERATVLGFTVMSVADMKKKIAEA